MALKNGTPVDIAYGTRGSDEVQHVPGRILDHLVSTADGPNGPTGLCYVILTWQQAQEANGAAFYIRERTILMASWAIAPREAFSCPELDGSADSPKDMDDLYADMLRGRQAAHLRRTAALPPIAAPVAVPVLAGVRETLPF
jgi:hypothetical protein